jgi:hypothetical protein
MYTADDIIDNIRIRATVPNSEQLFTPERLVALLTDEMRTLLVPQIMSVQEDYFLTYQDQSLTDELVYDMPEQAIGMKLKDVYIVDSDGQEIEKLGRREDRVGPWTNYTSTNCFHVQNNQIKLSNRPQGTSLRMYYYRRPNQLVTEAEAGRIESIDVNNNTVVLSTVPTDWEVGTSVCVIKGKPGFDCKVEATDIVSLSTPTVGLTSVTGLAVGDWVALEGYSPIPQLPVEAHPVLAQAVVVKVMESLGDVNGMQAAQAKLNKLQEDMYTVLNPRVDGAPKKIVSDRGVFSASRFNGYTRW